MHPRVYDAAKRGNQRIRGTKNTAVFFVVVVIVARRLAVIEVETDSQTITEEVRLSELVEVNVTDLYDAIAVKGAGKICDGDIAVNDINFVTGDLSSIEG